MSNGLIFVHIAAYRDPELVPTILDCIANARNPDRLRFGVVWQHAPEERIGAIAHLKNLRLIDVPHTESRGACWARALGQTLYNGEEFYLQLDSHHRFAKGWDESLKNMLADLEKDGIKKPVITGYTPHYDPANDPGGRADKILTIGFGAFVPDSVLSTASHEAKDQETASRPFRARFLAAGLIFARGSFVSEVPYDGNLYFQGEELNLGIRAFTHGWELFHPHRIVLWHYYTREGKPRHWTDHAHAALNDESLRRLKCLLSVDGHSRGDVAWGKTGLGQARTLRQWEHYTGIDLSLRRLTRDCLNNVPPTANWDRPMNEETWWSMLLARYEHTLEITSGYLCHDDYDFIYVGFDRKDGSNIHCRNITGDQLKDMLSKRGDPETVIPVRSEFFSDEVPHRWAFWPHSKSRAWTQRLCGTMPVHTRK